MRRITMKCVLCSIVSDKQKKCSKVVNMATIHICDRCVAQFKTNESFWVINVQPLKITRGVNDRKCLRMELCEKCKKHVYAALCPTHDV